MTRLRIVYRGGHYRLEPEPDEQWFFLVMFLAVLVIALLAKIAELALSLLPIALLICLGYGFWAMAKRVNTLAKKQVDDDENDGLDS